MSEVQLSRRVTLRLKLCCTLPMVSYRGTPSARKPSRSTMSFIMPCVKPHVEVRTSLSMSSRARVHAVSACLRCTITPHLRLDPRMTVVSTRARDISSTRNFPHASGVDPTLVISRVNSLSCISLAASDTNVLLPPWGGQVMMTPVPLQHFMADARACMMVLERRTTSRMTWSNSITRLGRPCSFLGPRGRGGSSSSSTALVVRRGGFVYSGSMSTWYSLSPSASSSLSFSFMSL